MLPFQPVFPADIASTPDPSTYSWPVVLMMLGTAVALFISPLVIIWFADAISSNHHVNWWVKTASGLLSAVCLFFVVALPIKVIRDVETAGGAWKLWAGFVLIGLFFAWWMHRITENSSLSWISAGVFVVFCAVIALFVSVSILLSALGAWLATIPVGVLVIVGLFIASQLDSK